MPSATMFMPCTISDSNLPAPEFDAYGAITAEVAGAGQHQIAEPRHSGECSGMTADRERQP